MGSVSYERGAPVWRLSASQRKHTFNAQRKHMFDETCVASVKNTRFPGLSRSEQNSRVQPFVGKARDYPFDTQRKTRADSSVPSNTRDRLGDTDRKNASMLQTGSEKTPRCFDRPGNTRALCDHSANVDFPSHAEGPAGHWRTKSSFSPKVDFAPIWATSQVVELHFRDSGKVDLSIEIDRFGLSVRAGPSHCQLCFC